MGLNKPEQLNFYDRIEDFVLQYDEKQGNHMLELINIDCQIELSHSLYSVVHEWLEMKKSAFLEANNLRLLATNHKNKCRDDSCAVSLMILAKTYSRLTGKKLSKEDLEVFS